MPHRSQGVDEPRLKPPSVQDTLHELEMRLYCSKHIRAFEEAKLNFHLIQRLFMVAILKSIKMSRTGGSAERDEIYLSWMKMCSNQVISSPVLKDLQGQSVFHTQQHQVKASPEN
jgi:hypothetical protein